VIASPESLVRAIRLALPLFKGPFLLLHGFFDGTVGHKGPRLDGVAGYLFDDDGLARFTRGWSELVADISAIDPSIDLKRFHAVECCGPRQFKHFERANPDLCRRICKRIAELTKETRLAGFVSVCETKVFDKWASENPELAEGIQSPYSIALRRCIERVSSYVKKNGNDRVFFWLEHGDKGQNEAERILIKIRDSEPLRERFSYFNHLIVQKGHSEAVALVSADLLAWEWNRNFSELLQAERDGSDRGKWTENFVLLHGGDDSRWHDDYFGENGMNVTHLINFAYGLTPD
jgi:hypothetical protein